MPRSVASAPRPSRAGFPPGHRRQAGTHRSARLVAALCLSLATGIALLGVAAAVTAPGVDPPRTGHSAANAELVHAFYAAVNAAVRTGDAGPVEALVAPDVTWCSPCSGQDPTHNGLTRYLAVLSRTVPDLRVTVESVVADDRDAVTARVRVSGLPLLGDPAPWGPVDTFRVAGGLIAERRSGPTGVVLVESLLAARLDPLPPAATGLALARLTFLPDSGVESLLSAGPTVLLVESGALGIGIARGGRVLWADGGSEQATEAPLASVLRRGDAAIVPAGIRYELRHQGPEPAVAVGVALFVDDAGRDGGRAPRVRLFVPPEPLPPEPALAPPVSAAQLLAAGAAGAWPRGPVRLAVGRMVLGPGARIAPAAGEVALVAVEAGILGLGGDGGHTVAAGAGVALQAGRADEVRNAGAGMAVLLVLTVAPAAG